MTLVGKCYGDVSALTTSCYLAPSLAIVRYSYLSSLSFCTPAGPILHGNMREDRRNGINLHHYSLSSAFAGQDKQLLPPVLSHLARREGSSGSGHVLHNHTFPSIWYCGDALKYDCCSLQYRRYTNWRILKWSPFGFLSSLLSVVGTILEDIGQEK